MDSILQYCYSSEEEEPDIDTFEQNLKVLCEICKENDRKYKCPACSLFTCSLECCKQHKIQLNCTGKRDRVSFVRSRDYKESHLINDFHFLEDVLQTKERGKRYNITKSGNYWQLFYIV